LIIFKLGRAPPASFTAKFSVSQHVAKAPGLFAGIIVSQVRLLGMAGSEQGARAGHSGRPEHSNAGPKPDADT